MVGRSRRLSARGAGYTLVALLVLVTVVNIAIAAALPTWGQMAKREKEAELVFRGLQYAEAIRVFQLRHGRYPVSLRELREIEPRSIRQLWTDPFNDDGEWGLIMAQSVEAPARQGAGDDEEQDETQMERRRLRSGRAEQEEMTPRERVTDGDGLDIPRAGQVVARGPIIGVKSLSDEESVRTFMGGGSYGEWLFTADLVPTLAEPALGENVPRLHSTWVGKAFPADVELPQAGGMPSSSDERANPLDNGRRDRRDRRGKRRGG